MLFKELNEKCGIEYLLMRRLTQDCIESLFSVLRAKGGNNLTPDASKIQSAIRINMCNMLISPSNNANCEKDASEFLALSKDIKTSIITLDRSYNESEEIDNIYDYYSSMNIEYILMKDETANSVAYVTGWVCGQLDHKPCIEKLATKDTNKKFDLDNTHIGIKEYDGCSLLYPLAKTLEFTKHVSALFHANIENLILKKKCNLKKDLKLIISHICKREQLLFTKVVTYWIENDVSKLKRAQYYLDKMKGSKSDSKKRSTPKRTSMKAHKKSCACDHHSWKKSMSKNVSKMTLKIESLQKQNNEIKTMLENFINKRTNSNSYGFSDDEVNELNIGFPLSDEIQLLEIESRMLNDQEFYSKMITTLKALGGTDFTSFVNTILAKLMTNCLAIRYSFAGRRKKISFKETFPTLLKTIINVVRFHKPTSTHQQIHNQIGRWLVHAQLRITRQETKQIDQ
ncbi:unnamed protein product [Macrosiphum euphorbiae]|uniref:DUF4806 domain-containing protein n=1 Tax=Macrosiphum euphorbiae TaxID=13131 RepID=A0AAV0WS52_9HEMI|nr:unnamed protein product [Macrosiphum euphorbiae]